MAIILSAYAQNGITAIAIVVSILALIPSYFQVIPILSRLVVTHIFVTVKVSC
ncbi:hypothetical protein KBT16_18850 [Nostoc sp. CCCryo 231-06]|nr:hypothetical protein [Nostoc sp. CCCryo 231-06]